MLSFAYTPEYFRQQKQELQALNCTNRDLLSLPFFSNERIDLREAEIQRLNNEMLSADDLRTLVSEKLDLSYLGLTRLPENAIAHIQAHQIKTVDLTGNTLYAQPKCDQLKSVTQWFGLTDMLASTQAFLPSHSLQSQSSGYDAVSHKPAAQKNSKGKGCSIQ